MSDLVRVRFAPSPTGHFHIGGARTALYNFLFARQTGGRFVLRIEDTDQRRSDPEHEREMMAALSWLGIEWDEGPDKGGPAGPYRQSDRRAIYAEHAQQLLSSGHAFRCFCTREHLDAVRKSQIAAKKNTRYDGTCRGLSTVESGERAAGGEPHTIRFRAPDSGTTTANDHLRGEITVDNSTLDDSILVKSDGLPVYHLAAMVDDHLMGISHVLRGAEWLGTFPLHALVIRAFGWKEPVWCHLSVFLKPSGKGKMSKRDVTSEQSIFVLGWQGTGDHPPTVGLRELGYVPEAILNWTALMGASFGDDEDVLTVPEMSERFRLDRLNPAPARVSYEKLDHFNGLYLRRLAPADLAARVKPFFTAAGIAVDDEMLIRIAPLIQPRIVTLDDAVEMAGFFFRPVVEPSAPDLVAKGLTAAESLAALERAHQALSALPGFSHEATEPGLRALAEELGLKPGQLFGILRVAITGQTVSPPLFESMAVIGRETCLSRLERAATLLTPLARTEAKS